MSTFLSKTTILNLYIFLCVPFLLTAAPGGGDTSTISGANGIQAVVPVPQPAPSIPTAIPSAAIAVINQKASNSMRSTRTQMVTSPAAITTVAGAFIVKVEDLPALQQFGDVFKGSAKGLTYASAKNKAEVLTVSLTILSTILENGPMTTRAALGLSDKDPKMSAIPENPNKLTLRDAFYNALADYKEYVRYLAKSNPDAFKKQKETLTYIRYHLDYLARGAAEFKASGITARR